MAKNMLLILFLPAFVSFIKAQSADSYLLDYCSYLGGQHFEQARDIAVDQHGFVYLTGGTSSPNFPTTPGAYNTIYNNAGSGTVGSWGPMMVFVSKFSPEGQLVWSTLLGGPNYDRAYAIEVDKDGYVYVGGRAGDDFPTTSGVVQEQFIQQGSINTLYGHQNGFIAKLSPDGSQLIWSSYYGSDSYGFFRDIDIDDEGYVYGILNAVKTEPIGVPDDAFDPDLNGNYDMVAVKFSPDATEVEWATFLGGTGNDDGGPSIQAGPDKSVYVAGGTRSTDIPVTSNAVQAQYGGAGDMFVARVSPDGKALIYGTYFGGSGLEYSETHSLFVDHLGQAYVACGTGSNDAMTTPGTIKPQRTGTENDCLFFKLSTDGTQLLASTYFGGTGNDGPEGLYVDSLQNLYVCGSTASTDLPVTSNAFQAQNLGGTDGLLVKMNPSFSSALYSTYFGGTKDDAFRAFNVTNGGVICASGQTLSTNLPVTSNAFQAIHASPNNNNRPDSFLSLFDLEEISPVKDPSKKSLLVEVYPNPFSNLLFINTGAESISQITLWDQLGRKHYSNQQGDWWITGLPTDELPSGIYWLQIMLEGEVLVMKKVIKP